MNGSSSIHNSAIRRRRITAAGALTACVIVLAVVLRSGGSSDAASAKPRPLATGVITAIGGQFFTVTTAGARTGLLNRMVAAGTQIAAKDLPYVWGGGHARAGIPDVGVAGHGNSLTRVGYDCSGAVGALLTDAGLMPSGESVPNDAGIVSYLLARGVIAPGPGNGAAEVTIYDDPGDHIFMNIDGRLWGTGSGGPGGNSKGGAGWLDQGASDLDSSSYKRYHVVASVLKLTPGVSYQMAFRYGAGGSGQISGLKVGQPVNVKHRSGGDGTMIETAVAPARVYHRHGARYIRQAAVAKTAQHLAKL